MPNIVRLACSYLEKLSLVRLSFLPLKKVDLIIYGHSHINFIIIKYFKKKEYKIIDRKKKYINIIVLIKYLFSANANYTYRDYLIFEINLINPKMTITSYDNDINFWKIADKLKCKTIIIQNGWRSFYNDIFSSQKKTNKKFNIDYICLWSEVYKKLYSKYLRGNFVVTGSIKNNFFKIRKNNQIYKITLISQFRKIENVIKSKYFKLNPLGWIINQPEERLLPLLDNFCEKNNIILNVFSTSINSTKNNFHTYQDEYNWFNGFLKNCKWRFIKNNGSNNLPYKIIDKSKLIICMDSSLGYESLARGQKTVFLPKRNNLKDQIFGWPCKLNPVGYFWISKFDINKSEFSKFLKKNLSNSNRNWLKTNKKIKDKLCFFDIDNKNLRTILDKNK